MDEAERIPIDIGYEVASAAAATNPRTSLRNDGTLVIDILVPQPCRPEPSTESEIVVCAASPVQGQSQLVPPDSSPSSEKIGEALNVEAGPLELGSIDRGDGTRAFGARVRF